MRIGDLYYMRCYVVIPSHPSNDNDGCSRYINLPLPNNRPQTLDEQQHFVRNVKYPMQAFFMERQGIEMIINTWQISAMRGHFYIRFRDTALVYACAKYGCSPCDVT
jgi:hypothetical protein